MENVRELALDVDSVEKQDVEKEINLKPNEIEALVTTGNFVKRFDLDSEDFDVEAQLEAEDAIKHWGMMDKEEDTDFHHWKQSMKPVEGVHGLFMRTVQVDNSNSFHQRNVNSTY